MDIGYNNHVGLESVIASLRDDPNFTSKAEKLRKTTLKKTLRRYTLKDAAAQAFCALDLVTEQISWDELRSKFSMDEIIDFGVDFQIARSIGLKPKYWGGNKGLEVLQRMNATKDDIKESITSLQDIRDANWGADTVKEAGFTMDDLIELGNVQKFMKDAPGWSIKEIVLAFNPTGDEWVNAGFQQKGEWDDKQFNQFVQPKTNKVEIQPYQYKKKETNELSAPKDYILQFDENKLNRVKF